MFTVNAVAAPGSGDKASDVMQTGDLAVVVGGAHNGRTLFRTYNSFVVLECPSSTWSLGCEVKVRLLPKGTVITLEVQ